MYASHDKYPHKKNQKPNILRKKPSVITKSNLSDFNELSDEQHDFELAKSVVTNGERAIQSKCSKQQCHFTKTNSRLKFDSYVCEECRMRKLQELAATGGNCQNNICVDDLLEGSLYCNNNGSSERYDDIYGQEILENICEDKNSPEPLLKDSQKCQDNINNLEQCHPQIQETESKCNCDGESQKSVFKTDSSESSLLDFAESMVLNQKAGILNQDVEILATDLSNIDKLDTVLIEEQSFDSISAINELLTNVNVEFQCNAPNCSKVFASEQKLKKHKLHHNKNNRKVLDQPLHCPVKKIVDKATISCGQTFHIRDELMKHLNEHHTSEEAPYRCTVCERRFFWASSLRVHTRAHSNGTRTYPCPWAGCDRVFKQPCRLREHSRAHTGDRPYACRHPECGKSFRTASKLLRHGRKHTGDRRFVCALCGRAFLRAEHLREHAARHLKRYACDHHGCDKRFANATSLNKHMKKVHKKDNPVGDEWHAARTHCTWPLTAPNIVTSENIQSDDVEVELSETSESNVYTVRSDLFLHGNILHNEDSQGVTVADGISCTDGGLVLLQDSLLDPPPTIDLMQEELMYADEVDETSFQILLLSEELHE